MQPSQARA
ncbi:unnamed protein product, partial [Didymodactylos carnosus]